MNEEFNDSLAKKNKHDFNTLDDLIDSNNNNNNDTSTFKDKIRQLDKIINVDDIDRKTDFDIFSNTSDDLKKNDRYKDVPEYQTDAHHGRDFNYHRRESCGIDADYIGLSLYQGYRRNGMLCHKDDYSVYNKNNKAPPEVIESIIEARKKACNCEIERKLTMEYWKKRGKMDNSHIAPYETAKRLCISCWEIEQEILANGYINKNSYNRFILDDILIELIVYIDELSKKPDLWINLNGDNELDKILKYIWNNTDKLKNNDKFKDIDKLKDNMSFKDFNNKITLYYYYYRKLQLELDINKKEKIINKKLKNKKLHKSNIDEYTKKQDLLDRYIKQLKLLELTYKKRYKQKRIKRNKRKRKSNF